MRSIREAKQEDIPQIRSLAHEIWPATYGSIISREQIDYMLEMMYSESSLQKQMQEGCIFLLAEDPSNLVGFASYQRMSDEEFKLHKLYVLPSEHGKGTGRALVELVTEAVKRQGGKMIVLQVNKNNPAKTFYDRLGFVVREEMVLEIGNGFVMDDFVMELGVGD